MSELNNRLVIGILAHVDAGKTTLAESILYTCGTIRKMGRVDHKDAFLDTYELERSRGITIFAKQAQVMCGEKPVTLLDTPGHVDFSAEMERTLQVLDYAVLVISGADGVQGHVQTLWRLLKRYEIPVFLFVNKMDQEGTDAGILLDELKKRLDERCVDFDENQDQDTFFENLAMCEEELMERYLENGTLNKQEIAYGIAKRDIFPCYFGSALKLTGVDSFLRGLEEYTLYPDYPEEFGARVFKIARDAQGSRLTYLKITGGRLKVKMLLSGQDQNGRMWEEKADQIRIYSGSGYQAAEEACSGTVCAVLGLSKTYSGQGLGCEKSAQLPLLEPVLTYQIKLPDGCDVHGMLGKLRQLEEEEPELHIVWKEAVNEIHAQVMGEVQIEILKSLIEERFGVSVEFGTGSIVYKETIQEPVEGIGHFEPLRHYAEVHLLLERGEEGSGLQFDSACSEDMLDRNWQRLVLTHLEERIHPGVLTGSEITDMKITLVAGRAHQKHTEGGDFRQATYRAVRHGLKRAKNVLLEPVYEFTLEIPTEMVGRAMTDIQKMYGTFQDPLTEGDMTVLKGSAPVVTMRDYQTEVTAYTRGRGRLFCTLKGYEPCHNAEEVIAAIGYDSEKDVENPTGSVFCSHGAGFVVSWDQVEEYAHLDSGLNLEGGSSVQEEEKEPVYRSMETGWVDQKELDAIFERTYGPIKRERNHFNRPESLPRVRQYQPKPSRPESGEEYLLVDGYNIIFAWKELKELAKDNIEGARGRLMDILCNYQGYVKCTVILVFDAYKVKGNPGEVQPYHNIFVVYTKEAETADQYIEKTVHQIGKKYHVTVATSDALEQLIIWGQGANRLSAQGFLEQIEAVNKAMKEQFLERKPGDKNYPFRGLENGVFEE
ncbi:translation elongation factor G [Clostridium sp. chh4-2]|uniref:translation factor GTPase family protein n=1 Tax=Clostridium sp. chh4-2 TaxID=2067550 RepID=UPI000CCDBF44|nr:TetM/TetW/TetO/TetS family tetracycline resistance ribosomal protection protein [Clostridium sp. chh4-2]PNV60956.1 translation elongation factor G [Clostridium sp. chh4-2]